MAAGKNIVTHEAATALLAQNVADMMSATIAVGEFAEEFLWSWSSHNQPWVSQPLSFDCSAIVVKSAMVALNFFFIKRRRSMRR